MAADTLQRACLIVEDELIIAFDLGRMLESAGYKVFGLAPSVDRALDLLNDNLPDLALLDENLSGMSVAPVAEALRANSIPFIVVSGYDGPRSEALHGAPRLSKPVARAALYDALSEICP